MVGKIKDDRFNSIAGALFGLAIGDALGAISEGMNPESIKEKYGRIQGFLDSAQMSTDDTEFSLFYALLLKQYGLQITSEVIAEHWLKDILDPSDTYKGAGFSESITLHNLKRGLKPPDSGKHVHSWSDGLAMCATPFGCVYPGQPEKASKLAQRFGQVSHAGEGIYGGMAVASAISIAMTGAEIDDIVDGVFSIIPKDCWTNYTIEKAVEIGMNVSDPWEAIPLLYDQIACTYYYWSDLAPEAIGIAFGLLAAGRGDYLNTVLAAVNLGRDADTVAAITGAICGCLTGYSSLPDKWRENIVEAPGRCIRSIKDTRLLQVAKDLVPLAKIGENSD